MASRHVRTSGSSFKRSSEIYQGLSSGVPVILTCIGSHTYCFMWDIINSTKPHEWVITSPLFNIDVIIYPYPKLDASLTNLCL